MTKEPFADVSPAARKIMRAVRGKDTKPELIVRKLAHGMGYRYRLHRADLPGRPDLVFGSRRKIVFVHGCFWHRHEGCGRATTPRTRTGFWTEKFTENVARDARNVADLTARGWQVLTIWECQAVRDAPGVARSLREFLDDRRTSSVGTEARP